jgi:hypothetical protein
MPETGKERLFGRDSVFFRNKQGKNKEAASSPYLASIIS